MALFQHSPVFNWFVLKRPYAIQKSFKNLSSGQRSSCRGSPPSCALAPLVPPVGNVGHMILKQVHKKIFLRSSFLNVAGPLHLGVGEDSCQVNEGGLRFLQRIQSQKSNLARGWFWNLPGRPAGSPFSPEKTGGILLFCLF